MRRQTPFHLVDNSPWPLLSSLSMFMVVSSFLFLFLKKSLMLFFIFFFMLLISFFWWRDVVRESSYMSFHSTMVQKNLTMSMIWFISSEVLFFFSFFWAFFHSSISTCVDLLLIWPPVSVEVLKPYSVPLLNTIVLLSSSITVTYSHYSIFKSDYMNSIMSLMYTIFLSIFFTFLQYLEYMDSFFTVSDSVYSSCFFMATSFHSFHVLVSTAFLLVSCLRMLSSQFNPKQHISLECSIWYWHFVDVVWVFLYISIYWWGSYI